MQETAFFVAEPKKVIITKKHFAVMLFAWWFTIQFIHYVIKPSAKIFYSTIFQQGIMNIYHHEKNQQNQSKVEEKEKIEKEAKKKMHQVESYQKQNQQIEQTQEKEFPKIQDVSQKTISLNSQSQWPKYEQRGISKNQGFKIHFKIKGKGKNIQEMKQKATEMSLKMAMQDYLLKKKHENQQ